MKKSNKLTILLAMVAAFALGSVSLAADVQHNAVLGGTVASVAPVGASVKEGDVLVTVNALAGPMPSARASVNGVVKAVMVHPGSDVHPGDVVIVVASK